MIRIVNSWWVNLPQVKIYFPTNASLLNVFERLDLVSYIYWRKLFNYFTKFFYSVFWWFQQTQKNKTSNSAYVTLCKRHTRHYRAEICFKLSTEIMYCIFLNVCLVFWKYRLFLRRDYYLVSLCLNYKYKYKTPVMTLQKDLSIMSSCILRNPPHVALRIV